MTEPGRGSAPHRSTVALVGNPNAGKTSVFNGLTGARQKVGNYPGVTVEAAEGTFRVGDLTVRLIDVPGLYSLNPVSADEAVASGLVNTDDDEPHALIYAVDASNLERNLFLFSQVAETDRPMVVALTMTDLLARQNRRVDTDRLAGMLGCPVVPVVAHKGIGVPELKEAVAQAVEEGESPSIDVGFPPIVIQAAQGLVERFSRAGVELSPREARCVILEEHCTTYDRFIDTPELRQAIDDAREGVLGAHGHGRTIDAQARYAWAARVTRQCVVGDGPQRPSRTEAIDRVLTHRVWGLFVFVGIMYLVFQSIYTLAKPLMALIQAGVGVTSDLVSRSMTGSPVLKSLVVDGVINGVGSVLVFLPQIMILFFFIAFLEGTGYLARAAFLMDKLLGWCGLNGRAFIPLLSSFACAVPGIMAARVMPDERSRLATVMVAPLMSCSARLPVYVLVIGVFIEPQFGPAVAGLALFAMHFVGLAVAIPVVWVLNKGVLKGRRLPFMLELPKYQWPKWKDVWITIFSRVKVFVSTAGTVIVAMSILIWAATTFPLGDDARYAREYAARPASYQSEVSLEKFQKRRQREDSVLGRFGRTLEPVFAPAGFDWRLTTAILAAFPAREVVVPAMGIIFESGEEDEKGLAGALQKATWPDGRKLMTRSTSIGLMVFFALCCQCMATLAAIRRETNSWKWPVVAFTYMTVLAYVAAVAIQVVGRMVGQ